MHWPLVCLRSEAIPRFEWGEGGAHIGGGDAAVLGIKHGGLLLRSLDVLDIRKQLRLLVCHDGQWDGGERGLGQLD